jgi:hypothetical protein
MAAEVSVGLLLYAGPGLVQSLTTILTVQAAALSLGLWTAPAGDREDLPEAVRRRWLLSLGAFALAALYSGFWSVLEPAGSAAVGQGLGLAFMGAFPLYAIGTALGGMAGVAARHDQLRDQRVGASAFMGAVLGFAVTGFALPRALAPASLFLGSLVLLSAGGLIWGGSMDRLVRTRARARRLTPWGSVRVEDRLLPDTDAALRVLWEGAHVRRWLTPQADALTPWDLLVFRKWAHAGAGDGRVLVVGGGASVLPGAAAREFPAVVVDVLEGNPAVVEMANQHMHGDGDPPSQATEVTAGPLLDGLEAAGAGYDLVVVDTLALGHMGGVEGSSQRFRSAIKAVVAPEGALAVGPAGGLELVPPMWTTRRMIRTVDVPFQELGLPLEPREEILVSSPAGGAHWLPDGDLVS